MVGLAVARRLSRVCEVVLLEARATVGSQTSSRNSEVIHSGVYYTPGTLKAKLAAPGCEMLYSYAKSRNIGHRQCGKIIVATSAAEAPKLNSLKATGEKNGVKDMKLLSDLDMKALEPQLRGHSGLLIPSTGIVNSHELMLSLEAEAEDNGAVVVKNCSVLSARISDTIGTTGEKQIIINTNQGQFDTDIVVNCAGHTAPSVAARIAGHPLDRVPRPYFCKGSYFKLSGNTLPCILRH